MEITVIAVGSTKWHRFRKNWGLSCLIDHDILFDTFGNLDLFLRNARKLCIDFEKIKHIIISHDHWDHTAGLWHILSRYKNTRVYICPHCDNAFKDRIRSYGVAVIEATDMLNIKDEIYTTGEVCGMTKKSVCYEQGLIIRTRNGMVILTGCAHPGIVEILHQAKSLFPHDDMFFVMGGFHLLNENKRCIETVMDAFIKYKVHCVAPTHCTGRLAQRLFEAQYRDSYIYVNSRDTVSFKT